jgi:methionyl-tRNA formyltransferase
MTNQEQKPSHSPLFFFGSSIMSVKVLNSLRNYVIIPDLIITVPDKPQGRKLELTPNPTKTWAMEHNIPCLEFAKLDDEAYKKIQSYSDKQPKIFIVASYGKIIPERFLEIPEFGALNIHPSKLPELLGAAPLQFTILNDQNKTAVTIIKMDKEMDHGPIFAQEDVDIAEIAEWPTGYSELELITANIGAHLIAENIDAYIAGDLKLKEQDHNKATFTKKITKEDGLINPWLSKPEEQRKNILKIKAFEEWPGTYFFADKIIKGENKKIRVIIKEAFWHESKEAGHQLQITRVIPEGGGKMMWDSFLQSIGRK